MNIRDLETLMQVVHLGSFAAAAREQNVDPSSVSRAVAALEAELGTRLFARNTRHLALTEAGSVFTERLPLLLEELSQARDAAVDTTGEVRGRLRVTVSNAFAMRHLSPLLPAFYEAHPAIELDLLLTESPVDLVSERVDVAIRLGNLRDSSLIAVPLMPIRYHVAASPAWVRAQTAPLREPQDLQAIRCLSFALAGFRDRWLFAPADGGAEIEVPVRPRLVSTNALMLRDGALSGLGPTLLADWVIGDDLASGALEALFPGHVVRTAHSPKTAWAVYPSRSHVPAKVRAFVAFLQAALGRGSHAD
ncbi:LysR family transcriptional regulator [Xylella fastidiosa]|uniref:LysR family transcriptional regulator n=1 Tax=Xylella fastidiosa TaxID=2371 RepID=A0ABC8ADR1_XYLFS|nr:LysR family transcriptional regulator [Xylella fastidiosa]ALR06546.1 LysR family transcriptional regulator [Xylella fastidiosa]